MTDLPKRISMRPVRRSATVLGTAHDEEGRPVVTIGCDCGGVDDRKGWAEVTIRERPGGDR